MLKQNKAAFSSFMKKQVGEKSTKKTTFSKYCGSDSSQDSQEEEKDKSKKDEELEEAKRISNSKASQYESYEMIKKMIIENLIHYSAIVFILVIMSIAIIEFGSAFLAFLNGLLYRLLMSAFGG